MGANLWDRREKQALLGAPQTLGAFRGTREHRQQKHSRRLRSRLGARDGEMEGRQSRIRVEVTHASVRRSSPSRAARRSSCPALLDNLTDEHFINSGHLATIYCTIADFSYDSCLYSRRLIQLPDGGQISLDFTPPITPEDPIDSRPILVCIHGASYYAIFLPGVTQVASGPSQR